MDGDDYYCTGTLVESAGDRLIISTAAHCVYDKDTESFATNIIFIPGQDDGGKDDTDRDCNNDFHGCFYPNWGLVTDKYASSSSSKRFNHDYGFYVVPKLISHDDMTSGDNTDAALTQMGISFDPAMTYNENAFAFGYPRNLDPDFMFTHGRVVESPFGSDEGYYISCSQIGGGGSGGPWTQSDPSTGQIVVSSVTSWKWSNSKPGIGAPLFNTGGAQCVYDAANKIDIHSGGIGWGSVEPCPP